ncbi:MAG: VOC family protein [Mycobacterium sp.]
MTVATGLSLLILYVSDIDASREFYTGLGLHLVREQHGRGPEHYSARLDGGLVLELYPCGSGPVTRTRLELRVPDAAPAAAQDPDGNIVLVLAA